MAKKACICGLSVSRNTGLPGCESIADAEKRSIFVSTLANDGTENYIDLTSDALDLPWWTDKINEADTSKRYYPTPAMENVEDTRADAIFQSFNSGKNIFIQEAPRTFLALFPGASATFLGQLENFKCDNISKYIVTKSGQLVGYVDPNFPDRLYPLPLDKNTFYAKLEKAVEGTSIQAVSLAYEYDESLIDSQIRLIDPADIGVNLRSERAISGLLDVVATEIAVTATSIEVDLSYIYGSAKNKLAFKGALPADFALENLTTPGVVPILTADETSDGVYLITFAAQTGTDEYQLSLNKDGFEMTPLTGQFV